MAFHWPRRRVSRARPGYCQFRSPGAASRRRTGLRPWAQLLEDRTLLSAFYNLIPLASTARGFTSFGDLPSINDQGVVAFVGNTDSGNGIWTVAPSGVLTNVTPAFTANNDGRTYGRGVAINDSGQIIARDQINSEFYVREWNADQPNQHTDLFKHPATGINSPDAQFASAQTFTATDNT